jgi:hypothetical protein
MPNLNSIYNIKNYFSRHNGLQSLNRFEVSFSDLPAPVAALEDSEKVYPVQSVTIGNRGMAMIADNLSGFDFGRMAPKHQKLSSELLLIFSISNDNHILKMFNTWFNYLYSGSRMSLNGNATSTTNKFFVPYYDEAVKKVVITVKLLNQNGGVNSTFTFYECMPQEINTPTTLDMSKTTEFLTYPVLFRYKEFRQD